MAEKGATNKYRRMEKEEDRGGKRKEGRARRQVLGGVRGEGERERRKRREEWKSTKDEE